MADPSLPVRLVLASASPARRATLRRAGVEPVVVVSGVDEDAVLARLAVTDPDQVALVLARAKAEATLERVPDLERRLVVGCDSVLDLDGRAFGKPADADEAVARWRLMRGRTGVLRTGHWLVDGRSPSRPGRGAVASATVRFADATDDEIHAYVATGEPLEVAGAFTIDGLGGPLVTSVDGDPHTVVGISLPLLRQMLAAVGVRWFDLVRPAA